MVYSRTQKRLSKLSEGDLVTASQLTSSMPDTTKCDITGPGFGYDSTAAATAAGCGV